MESLIAHAGVNVRPATLADIPFMDALQKMHSKQVGWMPTKQFEGKIEAGHVLVAEEILNSEVRSLKQEAERVDEVPFQNSAFRLQTSPVGYVIGVDRYFKREDVGIIYQMNVVPGKQRGFVGATLLKAQFERSAYGCRLYCCWCAQDIAANKFWEAMGFIPLAFREGSEKRARVHIFWQKRIRADDETTPYWFPSQTTGGAIGAGRLVLPIPPGTHWSDAKPLILPGSEERSTLREESGPKRLPKPKQIAPKPTAPQRGPISGLSFIRPPQPTPEAKAATPPESKPAKVKVPRKKNDPKLIAAARELRDRWLEQVNGPQAREAEGLVPQIAAKYDVRREIRDCVPAMKKLEQIDVAPVRMLDAA